MNVYLGDTKTSTQEKVKEELSKWSFKHQVIILAFLSCLSKEYSR